MKARQKEKLSVGYILSQAYPLLVIFYGPVKNFPHAVAAIQWVLFPLIVLSGLWL